MTSATGTAKTLATTFAALVLLTGLAWGAADGQPAPPTGGDSPAAAAGKNWQQITEEGYRLLAAGEVPAALNSFDEALRLNPRGAAAKTGKGVVLARQGKLQEAEQLLREALQLNPEPARTHYELGRIYQQRGDYQRAIDEFKQGIEKYRESHP